jgi:hypothetical protein
VDDSESSDNGSRPEGRRPKPFELRYAVRHHGQEGEPETMSVRFGRKTVAAAVLVFYLFDISVEVILREHLFGC